MPQHPSFQRFFIGLSIPEPENTFLAAIKRQYHPYHRLSSPPHITLMPPFRMPNKSYLLEKLAKVARHETPFTVKLDMIGSFKQPKHGTVFLEPKQTKQLKALATHLSDEIAFMPNNSNYYPHLTLAQRVEHDDLMEVKAQLRALELKLKLEIQSIELYAFDEETGLWEVSARFPFGS